MVAALLAMLFLAFPEPAPAQEIEPARPPRFLRLPDVTLSAEDPLYLSPPPVAGWSLVRIGQPELDRLRLSPVETPFRILPSRGPPRSPWLAASSLPVNIVPAPPGISLATPGLTPSRRAEPASAARPAEASVGEYSTEFRHVPGESTRAELKLDRNLGSWALSADGAAMLTEPSPSFALLELQTWLPAQPWGGSLKGSGSAVFSPDALIAGGLGASGAILLEGRRLRFRADTDAQVEYRQPDAAAGRVSQRLAVDPLGPGWGLYGSAQASLLPGPGSPRPQLDGLARFGVAWKAKRVPLELSAGGGLLYFSDRLAGYPEAQIEYRPASVLRIQAWLGPFLDAPISLLFRAVNDPGDQAGLHDQGGAAARIGLLLDLPRAGGAAITVQANDGFRYRLREGALRWEPARELELDVDSSWTLLAGSARRPQIALQAGGSAALPLPVPEQALAHLLRRSLDGGIQLDFTNLPLQLILQAHWGDFPLQAEQALLSRNLSLFSGWMASALLRGGWDKRLTWFAGVEVRQPAEARIVLGCTTRTRSGQAGGLAPDSAR